MSYYFSVLYFQINTANLDLHGVVQTNISLSLTIPFACATGGPCTMFVIANIPNSDTPCELTSIMVPQYANCGAQFAPEDVADTRRHKNITIQAVDSSSNYNNVRQEFYVFLQVWTSNHPFIHGNILDPIIVNVQYLHSNVYNHIKYLPILFKRKVYHRLFNIKVN